MLKCMKVTNVVEGLHSQPTHQLGTSVSLQAHCKAQDQYLCPDLTLKLSQFLQGGQRPDFGVGVCCLFSHVKLCATLWTAACQSGWHYFLPVI